MVTIFRFNRFKDGNPVIYDTYNTWRQRTLLRGEKPASRSKASRTKVPTNNNADTKDSEEELDEEKLNLYTTAILPRLSRRVICDEAYKLISTRVRAF
jgi:hypothetical protein